MNEDPQNAYRFVVTLYAADAYLPPALVGLIPLVANGAFQEVKGLSGEMEALAHPEGGVNEAVHQLPGRHKWGNLTLRRGVVRDTVLWKWYYAGLTQSLGARRDGTIMLLSPDGKPAMSWSFHGGIAVRWFGPELNAMQSAVAIEGLEIAHEGLLQRLE